MVYRCRVCGHIFDEKDGKSFSELTECPICKMGPDAFECIDDGSKGDGSSNKVLRVGMYIHMNKSIKVQNQSRATLQQCTEKCKQLYDQTCEFYYYSDLGAYDMTTLNRPFLLKLMKEIDEGKIDVVMVPKLAVIGSTVEAVCAFYLFLKERGVELVTLIDGRKVGAMIEKAMEKM